MKAHLLTGLSLLLTLATYAQVGIGTTTPDPSAQLDIVSTNKGMLVPELISTTAVTAAVEGLLVYRTESPAGYFSISREAGND
ncbi:hypothetical protein [Spirosoma koreense]